MDKKITFRDLIEDESFLQDYFYETVKNSFPELRKDALNVLGIRNTLNLIIKIEGEAWYDATLEQAELEDFGDNVRFVFDIHGVNRYISFAVPKPSSRR